MDRLHRAGEDREQHLLDLDEIARAGARRMLAEALEAEVQDYLDAARGERGEDGHALVVRNGHARERKILLGAGAVAVRAPRVNDKRVDEDGNRRLCTVFRVGTSYPPSRSSSVPRRDSRPLVSPALQSNGRPSGSDS